MRTRAIDFLCSLLALSLATAAFGAETPRGKQTLKFANGDQLFGSLVSMSRGDGLRWKHPDASDPIQFGLSNVISIEFTNVLLPAATNGIPCMIELVNDDSFEGDLVLLDEKSLTVDTVFGGRLVIPRGLLRTIRPSPARLAAIFEGPTGLDGWTKGQVVGVAQPDPGEWKYDSGVFYASRSASIARDLKLPAKARIEFDVVWRGLLSLAVALYTDSLQPILLAGKDDGPAFGGFYSLQLNSGYVNMLRVKKKEALNPVGQMTAAPWTQKNQSHITILASKEQNLVLLMADGKVVREWRDENGFAGEGTGLRIVHQGLGVVNIKNIKISEWDGRFLDNSGGAPADLKEDYARLMNGDRINGKLEGIHDGKAVFNSTKGRVEVPLGRVAEVDLPPGGASVITKPAGTLAIYFPTRGRLTLVLDRWEGNTVTGTVPGIGRVTLNPAAFGRVMFKPQ